MWERRTFHECAYELKAASADFKVAYLNPVLEGRQEVLKRSSIAGVEILKILSLTIRPEQDYNRLPKSKDEVGAFFPNHRNVTAFVSGYNGPYSTLPHYQPLTLRDSLNKIAHLDTKNSSFFVADNIHELIITGTNYNATHSWIALLDIDKFCDTILALPDVIR